MVWDIKWSKTAEDQLAKINKSNKKMAQKIVTKLEEITDDPYAYTKKLRNFNLRRLKVVGYRVLVSLEQRKMVIFVVETGPRGEIYEKYR